MVHSINRNIGIGPIVPKRGDLSSKKVNQPNDNEIAYANGNDKVVISKAAFGRHQNASILEKALSMQQDVRGAEIARVSKRVDAGFYDRNFTKLSPQIADKVISSDELGDAAMNRKIKMRLSAEDEKNQEKLGQIRAKIYTDYYENENIKDKVVESLNDDLMFF